MKQCVKSIPPNIAKIYFLISASRFIFFCSRNLETRSGITLFQVALAIHPVTSQFHTSSPVTLFLEISQSFHRNSMFYHYFLYKIENKINKISQTLSCCMLNKIAFLYCSLPNFQYFRIIRKSRINIKRLRKPKVDTSIW